MRRLPGLQNVIVRKAKKSAGPKPIRDSMKIIRRQ